MKLEAITPILNVSDFAAGVAWFESWGWKKAWDWGTPPSFGAVCCGDASIMLCQGAQGGRGRGANTTTFTSPGDEQADKGVWLWIGVDDVDELHRLALAARLDVTLPPTDMPWGSRELHLRHPDGHVIRLGQDAN